MTWYGRVRPKKVVTRESPEQFVQHQRIEALDVELAQYERWATLVLSALILLNILALGVLVYYILTRG